MLEINAIRNLANDANTPYHNVTVEIVGGNLMLTVEGIEDTTATHGMTRKSLARVADAIGISDDLYITGNFTHSGSFASVSFPAAKVEADIEASKE